MCAALQLQCPSRYWHKVLLHKNLGKSKTFKRLLLLILKVQRLSQAKTGTKIKIF